MRLNNTRVSFAIFILFAHLGFPCKTHEGTLPYRSLAQISCLVKVGVSFVALGVSETQVASHLDFDQPPSRAIGRTRLEGHSSEGPFS
jgi:hypothetical protein